MLIGADAQTGYIATVKRAVDKKNKRYCYVMTKKGRSYSSRMPIAHMARLECTARS